VPGAGAAIVGILAECFQKFNINRLIVRSATQAISRRIASVRPRLAERAAKRVQRPANRRGGRAA
jgi:hypothetical protein